MLKVKYVLFHHLMPFKLNLSLFCYQQIKQYVCLKIFKPSSNVQELQQENTAMAWLVKKAEKKNSWWENWTVFFSVSSPLTTRAWYNKKKFTPIIFSQTKWKNIEFCNVWMVKNIPVVHDSRKKSVTYEGVKSKILLLSYEASKSKIRCRCFTANSNMRCCLYLIGSTWINFERNHDTMQNVILKCWDFLTSYDVNI